MKKNSLKTVCCSIFLSAFFACTNDVPVELENQDLNQITKDEENSASVEMLDGVLKFRDAFALSDAMIDPKMVNTAKQLNNANFKSLGDKYSKLVDSYELIIVTKGGDGGESEIDDFIEIDDIIENPVRSHFLTDFLNEDGMMIVGDLAVRVIGDYAYYAPINSYKQLTQLTEKELKSSKDVTVDRIIVPMVSESAIQTKASKGGIYNRSYVFHPNGDKKRREYVQFNPYLFVIANAQTELVLEMEGRAQKKQLFGWIGSFSDEMVWGEIKIESGSWNYTQPPILPGNPAYHFPQGINKLPTGVVAKSYNGKFCGYVKKLGVTGGVSGVKAKVTFKAKKSDNQPADWKDTYTNDYTSITK